MDRYDFFKTKYGSELLIDLLRLETLEKYIVAGAPHVLSYYDITLVTEGNGNFNLDDRTYAIEPCNVYFSSPMQVRRWDIEHAPKGLVLIFEEEFLCTFFNDSQFIQKLLFFSSDVGSLCLSCEDFIHLTALLESIKEEVLGYEKLDDHILRSLLYQVLVWLNRQYQKANHCSNRAMSNRVFEFRRLVDKCFANHHSVDFYADQLSVTPGHLNDVIKENLGISAKQHLQNRLFLEAKRLLLYSSLSVSEVAWQLSFKDASYFTRAFKKCVGCTPLAYRGKINP